MNPYQSPPIAESEHPAAEAEWPALLLVGPAATLLFVIGAATLLYGLLLFDLQVELLAAKIAAVGAIVLGLVIATVAIGLVIGSRHAWWPARLATLVLAILGAFLGGPLAIMFLITDHEDLAAIAVSAVLFFIGVLFAGSFLLLSKRAAMEHCHLVCDACGHAPAMPSDLLFRAARCPQCGKEF